MESYTITDIYHKLLSGDAFILRNLDELYANYQQSAKSETFTNFCMDEFYNTREHFTTR